ncbi:MAG: GNAT family N-acetyltransferase [Thermodesulfobacteriota bacterium]
MLKKTSSLKVPNDPGYIKGITAYCRELSRRIGFTSREIREINRALSQALLSVITQAFNPYEDETFEVSFHIHEYGLQININDMGLPFSFGIVEKKQIAPGLKAIESNMDHVEFLNRGKKGKELQLFKYLKGKHVEDLYTADELAPFGVCKLPSRDKEMDIRLMRPEEAAEVSRCIYRTYRYTYLKEDLYFPERIASMNRTGKMISTVAVTEEGEVAGHFAIMPRPNKKVAEIGVAVVMPRYRGRGIMKKMLNFLMEDARGRSLYALYGNAFTIHALSQRANLKFGFHETALQLGCIPPGSIRVIKERGLKGAGNILSFFKYLRDSAPYPVFIPQRYKKIFSRIYSSIGIQRLLAPQMPTSGAIIPAESEMSLHIKPAHRTAVIEVSTFGKDFMHRLQAKNTALTRKHFNAVYLDLELNDPYTPEAVLIAEDLGFFFSGLLPDYSGGDIFRLQRYDTNIIYDEIHTSSAFGGELVDYVRSQDHRHRS